jgi:hypothetical protein
MAPDGLAASGHRTLLLAPPSISSHEEILRDIISRHDRSVTDLQMLDRLAASLVTLPSETYALVLLLNDADGSRAASASLLDRHVFARIFDSLAPGGSLQSQDGNFGQTGSEKAEAILAGLTVSDGGFVKPSHARDEAVPLRRVREAQPSKATAVSDAGPAVIPVTVKPGEQAKPAGVGFVEFSNGRDAPTISGEDEDEELIDEDALLAEEDLARGIFVRKHSRPAAEPS